MTIIDIRKYGDEVLRTPCKKVTKISSKVKKLIDDLLDSMYAANGVGLAAPQIGVNMNVFVIDVSHEDDPPDPIVFVNPVIVKKEGAVLSHEGCLSFPDVYINVKRYDRVIVKAHDYKNRPFSLNVKNGTLLCRAIQHEYDHLNGILFVDHSMNRFETNNELNEKGLPLIQEDFLLEEKELEEQIAIREKEFKEKLEQEADKTAESE